MDFYGVFKVLHTTEFPIVQIKSNFSFSFKKVSGQSTILVLDLMIKTKVF